MFLHLLPLKNIVSPPSKICSWIRQWCTIAISGGHGGGMSFCSNANCLSCCSMLEHFIRPIFVS